MRPSPTFTRTFVRSPPTIPYTHCTIGPVPRRGPLIWPTDHIITFSFLSLFSFTQHILSWSDQSQIVAPLMSLPIRYLPMASYFRLSIIFLALQILRHLPRRCDLFWLSCKPSHDHHQLYPIPIASSVQYHIRDLSYDLWTTLLHFPFLVSSLLPDASFCSPTNCRSSHHVIGTLPYTSPHTNLVLVLLIVCI